MPHTHSSLLVHCVFSTKDRVPLIKPELEKDVWAYIGGIARTNRIKPVAIGGIEDHVHDATPRVFTPLAIGARQFTLSDGAHGRWDICRGVPAQHLR